MPYHYSTYDQENEVRPRERAVIILGAGPNRIVSIEFDYSQCASRLWAQGSPQREINIMAN